MASGDTLVVFTPFNNEPPTSDFATIDQRNQHPILNFDGAANENAIFSAIMPRNYGGGGLTVYLHYSMSTETSNDIDWDVDFERIGDGSQDVDSDGFTGSPNSVDNTTVPGTSGFVDIVNVTFTDGADMDNIAVGELFRIKVTRDAASDTSTGDAELHAVEIKET